MKVAIFFLAASLSSTPAVSATKKKKIVYFIRHAETVTVTTVVGPAENSYSNVEWDAEDNLSFVTGDTPAPNGE